jgi:outer membrane murein-binding lipoprotein Lpp
MARRLTLSALALASASMLLVGCSDDDEPSACSDLQDLAGEVRELRDTDLIASGTDAVRDELADISESIDEAQATAGDQFGDELSAVETAASGLRSTVEDAGGESLADLADELSSGVDALSSAWDELTTSVEDELDSCDLSAET